MSTTLHTHLDPKYVNWNNDMQLQVTAKGCRGAIKAFLPWLVQWNCCYRKIDSYFPPAGHHFSTMLIHFIFKSYYCPQERTHMSFQVFIVTHSRKRFITLCMIVNIFASLPTAKQQLQHIRSQRPKSMSCSCLTAASLMHL